MGSFLGGLRRVPLKGSLRVPLNDKGSFEGIYKGVRDFGGILVLVGIFGVLGGL